MALLFRLHSRNYVTFHHFCVLLLFSFLPTAAVVECRDARRERAESGGEEAARDVFYAREDTVQIPCVYFYNY